MKKIYMLIAAVLVSVASFGQTITFAGVEPDANGYVWGAAAMAPGDAITVAGTGFVSGDQIVVDLTNWVAWNPGTTNYGTVTCTADATGAFSEDLVVADGTPAGAAQAAGNGYMIQANYAAGFNHGQTFANVPLAITEPGVSPAQGTITFDGAEPDATGYIYNAAAMAPGDAITVAGTGFADGDEVVVNLTNWVAWLPGTTNYGTVTCTADATGAFSEDLVVADGTPAGAAFVDGAGYMIQANFGVGFNHGQTFANVTLEIIAASSIDDDAAQLEVYPNPANDVVNIANGSEDAVVNIYSIGGQLVSTQVGSTIDVSDLASGLYLLESEGTTQRISVE